MTDAFANMNQIDEPGEKANTSRAAFLPGKACFSFTGIFTEPFLNRFRVNTVPITKLTSDKRLTRRSFIKKGIASGAVLTLLGLSGYSFFVEKNDIELSRIQVSSPRLPASFKHLKILHISDFQISTMVSFTILIGLTCWLKELVHCLRI